MKSGDSHYFLPNRIVTTGGASVSHDARGNLTSDGTNTFGYSSENLLTSATVAGTARTLGYDPLNRLYSLSTTYGTRFLYDGAEIVAEYDNNGALVHRYVRADGVDQPVVAYLYSGTTNRRFYHPDERGSIVAISDGAGNIYQANRFDEYGIPGPTNSGRFQYTGQAWLAEIGLHHYRARMYNPRLGRFMQTDPIGYGSGMNLYAYVRGDPVNLTDPSGLQDKSMGINFHTQPILSNGDILVCRPGAIATIRGCFSNNPTMLGMSMAYVGFSVGELGLGSGRGPGAVTVVDLDTKWCVGRAEFTAVGGNQAPSGGALAPWGLHPVSGSVAVDPEQFGVPYGGDRAFNERQQGIFAPIALGIRIFSPEATRLARQFGGPNVSSFTIGDIGDIDVRSGDILRLDLYRFPTRELARAFGNPTLPVVVTGVPRSSPCPPGTAEPQ